MKCCTVRRAFEAMQVFISQLRGAMYIRLHWFNVPSGLPLVKYNITMGNWRSSARALLPYFSYFFTWVPDTSIRAMCQSCRAIKSYSIHCLSHLGATCLPLPRGLMRHIHQYWVIIATCFLVLTDTFPQGSHLCRETLWCAQQPVLPHALVNRIVKETSLS